LAAAEFFGAKVLARNKFERDGDGDGDGDAAADDATTLENKGGHRGWQRAAPREETKRTDAALLLTPTGW